MDNQDKLFVNNYPEWLKEYETAMREAAERSAEQSAPQTGDPMMDYKARAEAAMTYLR